MRFQDRIVELRRLPASSLRPHPQNWRTHPTAQQDALRGILAEIGFAGAELVCPADGLGKAGNFDDLMLIDGHLRAELAGSESIPVLVTDLTAGEANKLLATFDPLSAMADVDVVKLNELLHEVQFSSQAVADMLTELAAESGIVPDEDFPEIEETTSHTCVVRYHDKEVPLICKFLGCDELPDKLGVAINARIKEIAGKGDSELGSKENT